jgi:hypothetical protein
MSNTRDLSMNCLSCRRVIADHEWRSLPRIGTAEGPGQCNGFRIEAGVLYELKNCPACGLTLARDLRVF